MQNYYVYLNAYMLNLVTKTVFLYPSTIVKKVVKHTTQSLSSEMYAIILQFSDKCPGGLVQQSDW